MVYGNQFFLIVSLECQKVGIEGCNWSFPSFMASLASSLMVTKVSPGGAETAFWEPPHEKVNLICIDVNRLSEHGGDRVNHR